MWRGCGIRRCEDGTFERFDRLRREQDEGKWLSFSSLIIGKI